MQLFRYLALTIFCALSVRALPVEGDNAKRNLISDIHITDSMIVFDAPAYPDPNGSGDMLANIQTYAFSRILDFGSIIPSEIKIIIKILADLGVDAAQKVERLEERVKLFLSVGLAGKSEAVTVQECSLFPQTAPTNFLPDLGLAHAPVSLGKCETAKTALGTIQLDALDSRKVNNTIYFSPDSGFGVISDIDDTVKISHVLDKIQLAKATLIDDPEPVAGMPDLYASLARSLSNPQFIYVSGSPFQLYPFLNQFIKSSFSASSGPIMLRNLTITNPGDIVNILSGGEKTLEYKVSQIDRIHAMYPNKKWLAIGDSTEKDPETYATIFKKYPGFISCIWIRRVDGAANDQARFDTAFAGVPKEKTFVYTDDQVASLKTIDVANGKCGL